MAERAQQARIDVDLVPIRAEAHSLVLATVAVSFFPWVAIAAAVVFAVLGHNTAAIISGVVGVAGGGVQIIQALRTPRRR